MYIAIHEDSPEGIDTGVQPPIGNYFSKKPDDTDEAPYIEVISQEDAYSEIYEIARKVEISSIEGIMIEVNQFIKKVTFNADRLYIQEILDIAKENTISGHGRLLKETLEAFFDDQNNERMQYAQMHSSMRARIRKEIGMLEQENEDMRASNPDNEIVN